MSAEETIPQGAAMEAPAAAPEAVHPEVARLTQALEEAQAQQKTHWDKLVRQQAENQNMARRHKTQLEEAHRYGNKALSLELLAVLDGLESGLKHTHDRDEQDPVLQGLHLTRTLLLDILAKQGVVPVPSQGLPFNPEVHEALAMEASETVPAQHVIQVIQEGYRMHDRVLRPARVLVSKGPVPVEELPEQEPDEASPA